MTNLQLILRMVATAMLWIGFATVATASESRPLKTASEWTYYKNDKAGLEIPALVVSPSAQGNYPAVLYIHGRWGLSSEVKLHLQQIAERGVIVMAPDYHFARAIPMLDWSYDKEVVDDVLAGIPHLLKRVGPNKKIGIIAQDHGGFYGIKAAAKYKESVGALIGYYALMNDPSQPKARHIYGYMREVDDVKAPTMLMIGGEDREMRRIANGRVVDRLKHLKTPVTHVVYPGADRCFDWRINNGNFVEETARIDSLNRIATFLKLNVGGSGLMVLQSSGWHAL